VLDVHTEVDAEDHLNYPVLHLYVLVDVLQPGVVIFDKGYPGISLLTLPQFIIETKFATT
jgi:hypothetical protein